MRHCCTTPTKENKMLLEHTLGGCYITRMKGLFESGTSECCNVVNCQVLLEQGDVDKFFLGIPNVN